MPDDSSEPSSPHAASDDKEHTDDESTMPLAEQLERHARPLLELRPTQLAVGMQQVMAKRDKMAKKVRKPKKLLHFLETHPIPGVLGPGNEFYIVDHHHLASALLLLGVPAAQCVTLADWSDEGVDEFWKHMEHEGYVWRFDSSGAPLELADFRTALPKTVAELADDPYRSLAALVRRAGGYSKVYVPFSEFKWANWLRQRLPGITTDVATSALSMATSSAGTPARHLASAAALHGGLCYSSSAPQASCSSAAATGNGLATAGPGPRRVLQEAATATDGAPLPVTGTAVAGSAPSVPLAGTVGALDSTPHATAVALALQLAQSADAAHLPGFLGGSQLPHV